MYKILFALICCSTFTMAQKNKSVVADKITKEPLPQANIKIKGTNTGTVANNDGQFSINKQAGVLKVSFIGYFSKEVNISNLPDTVFLEQNNVLNEVVVMSDSTLKVLLRSAYNNINKNYPQQPSFLTGFYREVNTNLDSNRFNYFSESALKTYKPAYNEKASKEMGQIKVIKTRNVQHPVYEKSNVQFSGGPFVSISLDWVNKQATFLEPKNFKKYNYAIEKMTSIEGSPVFVINFMKKDSLVEGKLFIEKTSKAYVKIETYSKVKKTLIVGNQKDSKTSVVYEKKDSLWQFKYGIIEANFKILKQNQKITAEYVALSTSLDSVKAFSYNEQFERSGVILKEQNNISDDFFKEYDGVLQQSNALKEQVNVVFKVNAIDSLRNQLNKTGDLTKVKEPKKESIINKFLGNIHQSYMLGYAPIGSQNNTFTGSLNNVLANPINFDKSTSSKNIPLLFNYNLKYFLGKHWRLSANWGGSFEAFSNTEIETRDFGIEYKIVLNPQKKPFFIIPSIKYSIVEYGVKFKKFKNPDRDLVLNNDKFNSKNLRTGIYNYAEGLKFGLTSNILNRRRKKLLLGVDYFMITYEKQPYFELKENSAFLQKKKNIIFPLNDSKLNLPNFDVTKLPKINGNLWFSLTYKRQF